MQTPLVTPTASSVTDPQVVRKTREIYRSEWDGFTDDARERAQRSAAADGLEIVVVDDEPKVAMGVEKVEITGSPVLETPIASRMRQARAVPKTDPPPGVTSKEFANRQIRANA